jgi:hypothetical protein
MADVRIHVDDREVQDYLQTHGPRKVHNALRSAIRTTTTWAEKRLDAQLAAETELPPSVFRRFRVKKKIIGGSAFAAGGGRVESGRIWEGRNPVQARFAGRLEQTEGGAFAGVYYFPGGFIATMPSGVTSVFKRTGEKRDKNKTWRGRRMLREEIEQQVVKLPQAEAVAEAVASEAQQELLRRFRARFAES